jgi:hypothetical protein
MKNLLALIGLIVVGFAATGWYCGWYTIGTEPGSNGHRKINVDVNTNEITNDLSKVKAKVGDIINNETKGTPMVPTLENKTDNSQSPGVHFGPNGAPVIVLPKLEIKTGS